MFSKTQGSHFVNITKTTGSPRALDERYGCLLWTSRKIYQYVYFNGKFLLRWQAKNKTTKSHTLYVTSPPVMHLVFVTHETVTTQRGATNIVSYIQANRTEWKVFVDGRGETNFLRQMVTYNPTKQHTLVQQINRRNLKLSQSPNLPVIAANSKGSIAIVQVHPCLTVTLVLRRKCWNFSGDLSREASDEQSDQHDRKSG